MFFISQSRNGLPRWAHVPPSIKQRRESIWYRIVISIAFFIAVFIVAILGPFRFHTSNALFHDPISEEEFISTLYQATIDDFNPAPISTYCAHENWNTSVVINCDRIFGGIGNTRQRILTCLRHGMKSGMGLIIPKIELRSKDDLAVLESDGDSPLEYSFNREILIDRLNSSCPKMTIYNTIEAASLPGIEIYHFPTQIGRMSICEDDAGFATNFGSLLMFPEHIYHLAFQALYTMNTQHQVTASATNLSSPTNYMGLHLRTSSDATQAGWSSFEKQSEQYLRLASSLPYSLIYLASGNGTSISQFREEAKNMTVVVKEDLLPENGLEKLRSLTWDQAALVDYLILRQAGFFAGLTESSFSWNVAGARTAIKAGVEGVCGNQEATFAEGVAWQDEWSLIIGDNGNEFKGRLWP
ncbi:hypothetical protein B0O99DRAFT_536811 [Bisporella sp. PMI_857]|nr:hypothetical protein B0O99DRAFT_536811 [Bisporella sp. PMI_857]